MKNKALKPILKLLIILLLSMAFMNCATSRKSISFEKVKEGQQLSRGLEISVDQFLQIWMENRHLQKVDLNCYELYRDNTYTYFGEYTLMALSLRKNLYKIQNDSLNQQFPNYPNMDGQMIRQEFWEEVIPQSDKDIRKNAHCNSSSSNPKFSYELENDKIKVILEWKFRCDYITLIKKTYLGYYDMEQLEIEKTKQ